MERYHNIGGHLRLDPNGTLIGYADHRREVEGLEAKHKEAVAMYKFSCTTRAELTKDNAELEAQLADLQGQLEAASGERDKALLEWDCAKEVNEAHERDKDRLQAQVSQLTAERDDLRRANDGHRRATTHMLDELETLRGLVEALYRNLPIKRDWLDPVLEQRMKATLAQAQPKEPHE